MEQNKKRDPIVTIIIIVIIAVTAGFFGWLFTREKRAMIQRPAVQIPAETPAVPTQQETQDTILINRNDGIYEINLATKEVKPYNNPTGNLAGFSGLPKEIKNNKISLSNSKILLSNDKKQAIIVSTTFDETKQPSEFDGSLPILKAEEFICDTMMKKCSPTNILASAYKALGFQGTWYGQRSGIWWYEWNITKNFLYGHLTGEGIGNASPVYIFDIDKKVLQQTTGYNSLSDQETRAGVPAGAFSPSLAKFVMIDKYLLLYDSINLSAPLKSIDISAINDGVDSVAWSTDEKTLVLATRKQIYTLNLDTGKIDLRYTDTSEDTGILLFDFNAVNLSQSGRYIVFVDYDNGNINDGEKGINTALKAIDIQNNNRVIEIHREEEITLNYRF